MPTTTVYHGYGPSIAGSLFVAWTAKGVCQIELPPTDPVGALKRLRGHYPDAELQADPRGTQELLRKVDAYIGGQDSAGPALDLQGTPFQLGVWKALRKVPRGKTLTYTQLAEKAGVPRAVRAVASCCARNPVPIFVPCHRILRRGGGLGGYGGGLDMKRHLLALEGVTLA